MLLLVVFRGRLGYNVHGMQAILELVLQKTIDHAVALHGQLVGKLVRDDEDAKVCLQVARVPHGRMFSMQGALIDDFQVHGSKCLLELWLKNGVVRDPCGSGACWATFSCILLYMGRRWLPVTDEVAEKGDAMRERKARLPLRQGIINNWWLVGQLGLLSPQWPANTIPAPAS